MGLSSSRLVFLFALLLSQSALAYQINVKVVDKDNTPMYNSRVEVLQGNTVIASAIADRLGNANFTLSKGTYFLRPVRPSYPDQILMFQVKEDADLTAVILINRETAILYGQVAGTPSQGTDGSTLYATQNGLLAIPKTGAKIVNGYFVMGSIWPGAYELRLDNGSAKFENPSVTLEGNSAKYVSLKVLDETKSVAPSITAPATAAKFSTITAVLKNGDAPAANQPVIVYTPEGIINAKSDEAGRVAVNAVSSGAYTFSWSGQIAKTTVESDAPAPPVVATPSQVQAPPANAEILPPPAAPSEPNTGNKDATVAAMGGGLLLIAVFAAAAIIGALLFFALKNARGEKPNKPLPPQQHAEEAKGREDAHGRISHKKARHKK